MKMCPAEMLLKVVNLALELFKRDIFYTSANLVTSTRMGGVDPYGCHWFLSCPS